jgi:hypothetical protein
MMLTGRGLDPWGFLPGLDRLRLVGLLMRADSDGREAYAAMTRDPLIVSPVAGSRYPRGVSTASCCRAATAPVACVNI